MSQPINSSIQGGHGQPINQRQSDFNLPAQNNTSHNYQKNLSGSYQINANNNPQFDTLNNINASVGKSHARNNTQAEDLMLYRSGTRDTKDSRLFQGYHEYPGTNQASGHQSSQSMYGQQIVQRNSQPMATQGYNKNLSPQPFYDKLQQHYRGGSIANAQQNENHHSSYTASSFPNGGQSKQTPNTGKNIDPNNDTSQKSKNSTYFSNQSSGVNQGSSGQNTAVFKLPSIKGGQINEQQSLNMVQMRSPQRISHHFEALDPVSQDTDRRKQSLNPAALQPTLTQKNLVQDQNNQQILQSESDRLNLKKAAAQFSKKQPNLTEDLILRNAKLIGSNNNQFMILLGNNVNNPINSGLAINGQRHDILLQEQKQLSTVRKPSQVPLQVDKPQTVKAQSLAHQRENTYLDLIKAAQQQQNSQRREDSAKSSTGGIPYVKKQYANVKHRTQKAETLRSSESQSPLVTVKLHDERKILNNSRLQHEPTTPDLNNILVAGPSVTKMPIEQQFQSFDDIGSSYQIGIKPLAKEFTTQEKYDPISQNPYQQVDGKSTQVIQSEFLSPKLLYKKKKREYYQSQSKGNNQQQPINLNTQNQQYNQGSSKPRESPLKVKMGAALASSQITNVINQLLLKNASQSQHINFVQALKNINSTANQLAMTNAHSDMLDSLTKAALNINTHANNNPSSALGKSISQETLDDTSLAKLASTKISLPNSTNINEERKEQNQKVNKQNTNPITQNINALAGQLPPPSAQQDTQQQMPQINFKNLHTKNGRILSASELYEIAKQIKYKQLYSIQARRQQSNQSPMQIGMMFDKKSPRALKAEIEGSLKEALNVVKLSEKKSIHMAPIGNFGERNEESDSSQLNFKTTADKYKVFNSQYKLDSNFISSNLSPGINISQKITGPGPDLPGFIIRYTNKNNEVTQCYEELPQVVGRDLSTTVNFDIAAKLKSQSSKQKLNSDAYSTYESDLDILGSLGTPGTLKSKGNILQQSNEFNSTSGRKNGKNPAMNSYTNGPISNQILISQVHEILGDEQLKSQNFHMIDPQNLSFVYSDIDPQQLQQFQLLALGQPMKMITEADEIQESPLKQQPQENQLQKELQRRLQKKKQKQIQLSKITKISELEKLLYTLPGLEEAPVINQNPGGGGRVTNRNYGDKAMAEPIKKRRLEMCINDNENAEFAEHQINKTIKMMGIMNAMMFKINLKEINTILNELVTRCARYFNLQIPKQFKNDLNNLMKQKDFLSLAKEKMISTFHAHLNKTNGITDQLLTLNQSQGQYKYFIGGGNNHMLVKTVFKQRAWWIQNEKETFEECNFIWTQWLKERHIKALPKFEQDGSQNTQNVANGQDPQEQEIVQQQPIIRIYNKMHGNQCISDKKHLYFNIRDLYKAEGKDPFIILPLTYVINDGLNDVEFDRFEETFRKIEAQSKQKQAASSENGQTTLSNIWIIKPGEDTNRGSGIIVSKDFQEIKQIVRDKSSKQDKTAILQKYIENPLLINKRKFDIRCYGLLTSINGHMLGYFYTDGYLRTSSKEFSTSNLSNKYIHLTNDAIQKNSEDYGKFENANKLSFSDFDRYFAEFPHQDYEMRFTRDFLPQIRAMVRDSFRCAETKIDSDRRTNTFEIFGYDFMIDDELNIKLIEVNTNPSIEVCCPLLARIIPNMLDSVFRIAIDPLFQQPQNRRVYNGAEVVNDLKMELVFESSYERRKTLKSTNQGAGPGKLISPQMKSPQQRSPQQERSNPV